MPLTLMANIFSFFTLLFCLCGWTKCLLLIDRNLN